MIEERFDLHGDSTPVQLDQSGITLVAPGLFGSGSAHPRATSSGGRATLGEQDEVVRAITESGGEDRYTLLIEAPTPSAAGGGRGAGDVADNEMLVQVPLGAEEGAFLMYVDEAGIITYHFAESPSQASTLPSRAFDAARQASYRIPLRTGESRTASGDGRGLFARLTSKIIKVVVVKLFPDAIGGAVAHGVRLWEEKRRSHQGLHTGSWAQLLDATPVPAEDLARVAEKRSLLLIHGTTSTTGGAFGGLAGQATLLDRLQARYEGRIFGFNHHTMSRGVAENVQQFLASFDGAPGKYTFDIICHSRGGLLARALAAAGEGKRTLSDAPCVPPRGVQLAVDRIAFVATPNAGTIMAEPDGLPKLVERLTNVVNQLPDSALVIAAGALAALAGAAVQAAIPRLPGLADQVPNSPLQIELGAARANHDRYFALCAEYQPTGNLVDVIKRKATDVIFGEQKNDLVVPTLGVATTPYFRLPAERVVQFAAERGVHHSAFFKQPEMARVVDWLERE